MEFVRGSQDRPCRDRRIHARCRDTYIAGHIPGAVSFPHREMNSETTARLNRGKVYVVYCDGIGGNASTKGAYKRARLGFRTKELLGGLDWWRRDGVGLAQLGGGKRSFAEQNTRNRQAMVVMSPSCPQRPSPMVRNVSRRKTGCACAAWWTRRDREAKERCYCPAGICWSPKRKSLPLCQSPVAQWVITQTHNISAQIRYPGSAGKPDLSAKSTPPRTC